MLLEKTADALLSRDFDQFSLCFHLPHVIETGDNKRLLETPQDLRAVFDSVTADYASRRVTQLVRICEVAEYVNETKFMATHITHMMSGHQRINDPFPCYSVIEFIDGRWQITSSQYAVDRFTLVGRALAQHSANTDAHQRPDHSHRERRQS